MTPIDETQTLYAAASRGGRHPNNGAPQRFPRPAGSGTYRVVVVSGDVEERKAWTQMLSHPEFTVVPVSTGEAALKAIEAGGVHLVVSAVVISRMDGLELLRETVKLPQPPPAILIARGHGEIDCLYLKIAALQGAAATFTQPLSPKPFLRAVRAALGIPRTD